MPKVTENTDEVFDRLSRLKPQCEKCFGLCCVALFYSKQDGFPADKSAGTPCPDLDIGYRCAVHENLIKKGLKGCAAYECFGAGQQVSQVTFAGQSWRESPACASMMFEVFLTMRQLYEICWYLNESLMYKLPEKTRTEAEAALNETERIIGLPPRELAAFDMNTHHSKIRNLLRTASEYIRGELTRINNIKIRPVPKDLFGKDLRKKDLRGADLRGACLIAADLRGADLTGADFTGADLRDAIIKGANLTKSLFLTQFQLNTAKGNAQTKLPAWLSQPAAWC